MVANENGSKENLTCCEGYFGKRAMVEADEAGEQ